MYVHKITVANLSKIYFLKNEKKTCKPNNRDLNRNWIITVMQAKAIASSFVNTQFNNCAILWMFSIRKSKLRLEIIHKRTLRVVYDEYEKNGPCWN